MKSGQVAILSLILLLMFAIPGTFAANEQPRGKYVYDYCDRLSVESRAAVSNILWRIDSTTTYEFVIVFPKEDMIDSEIIRWFNDNGVGKTDKDNGAALFMFSDGKSFLSIGSGNDVVTVVEASTHGKEILKDFDSDPTVTLIRFINLFSKRLSEKTTGVDIRQPTSEWIKDNFGVIMSWGMVLALLVFLVQQKDGFQKRDLYAVLLVLMLLGGVYAYGTANIDAYRAQETRTNYGIIDTTNKWGPQEFPIRHEICTTDDDGNRHCTVWYTTGYRYYNDVTMIGYDLNGYSYRFISECDSCHDKRAWDNNEGDVWGLTVRVQSEELVSIWQFKDNSGGTTSGDGIWLR